MFNFSKLYGIHRQIWAVLFAFLVTYAYASDLSIYQPAQNGTVSMVMMLDTSGSMGDGTGYSPYSSVSSIIGDYGFTSSQYAACTSLNATTSKTKNGKTTTTTTTNPYSTTTDSNNGSSFQLSVKSAVVGGQILPAFSLDYCPAPTAAIGAQCALAASYIATIAPSATLFPNATSGGVGTYCFDRISRLKMGMFGVLINNSNAVQNTIMGVGNFSAQADGSNGEILVPAVLLGPVSSTATASSSASSQRYILANTIAGLSASNGTPTASGYAEAAAYLLGNKASSTGFTDSSSYGVAGASNTAIVSGSKYNSPVVANKATSCGQGVYILSDGEPNAPGATTTQTSMKAALGTTFSCPATGTAITGTTPATSTLLSSYNTTSSSSAWECVGGFAQALNNAQDVASDGNKYPIQTAFVAFGTDFVGLTVPESPLPAPSGSTYYYDAVNVCELASRPAGDQCSPNIPSTSTLNPNGGYGGGGFYMAQQPSQVTASVQGFIQTLSSAKVAPLSTGSATAPVDTLNPNGFEPYVYLKAISPTPADANAMSWSGNIKKYAVNTSGIIVDANGNPVFQVNGNLVGVNGSTGAITPTTVDLWNNTNPQVADGGLVTDSTISGVSYPASGTLDKIPEPVATTPASATTVRTIRTIFTDIDSSTGKDLMSVGGTNLLQVPPAGTTLTDTGILNVFTSTFPYNASTPATNLVTSSIQIELLNFLGYSLPLNSTLPTAPLTLSNAIATSRYLGGTLHSQPISITYSGAIDSNGNLTKQRNQALLYGSMDGAIHLVSDSTDSNGNSLTSGGVEQMVFIPNEILTNTIEGQALKGGVDNTATVPTTPALGQHTAAVAPIPSQGADGPWVADPAYKTTTTGSGSTLTGTIKASQMYVYGGLRMGGSSYYGLDLTSCALTTPCTPKLLFKVGPQSGSPFKTSYTVMGQSWSKPVMANIRYGNKIVRVMVVGGGYDLCYENPMFKVGATAPASSPDLAGCSGISSAAGNAVYIINAKTGAAIWTFTANCSGITNCSADPDMVDSIVSPIAVLDRDGDGLIDNLYFGDLGGKVYRADVNNNYNSTSPPNFGVRVTTLANLATTSSGAAITAGNAPRFYEQPNLTYYSQNGKPFFLVNVASGDRSSPLDVYPTQAGGKGLSGRPVNNVYGIIDSDATNTTLITGNPTLVTKGLTLKNLLQNPQTDGVIGGSLYSGSVPSLFLPSGGTYNGWYRSLSANDSGTEPTAATYNSVGVLTGGSKTPGGKKAFEKPVAIQGYLVASVYDPEGTSVPTPSACSPRVIGETDSESFCLPYGACINSTTGKINTAYETNTGAVLNPASSSTPTLMGPGIRAVQLVSPPLGTGSGSSAQCSNLDITNNQSTQGQFGCEAKLIPTVWYEKQPNSSLVN